MSGGSFFFSILYDCSWIRSRFFVLLFSIHSEVVIHFLTGGGLEVVQDTFEEKIFRRKRHGVA